MTDRYLELQYGPVDRETYIKNIQEGILFYESIILELNRELIKTVYGDDAGISSMVAVEEGETKNGLTPITLRYERFSMGGGEIKMPIPEWYGAKLGDVFYPVMIKADYRYNMD